MSLNLEDLVKLLNEYKKRLNDLNIQIHQLTGAAGAIENQINMLLQRQREELNNATQEGKQQGGDCIEHQEGNCSGEEAESSSSDSFEQSGQEQQ